MILFAMLLYHIDGNYHWQNYIFVRWLMGTIAILVAFNGILAGRYFCMALISAAAWLSLEYQGIKWGTQEGKDYIVRTIRADGTIELFPLSREDRLRWEREVVAYTRDNMFLQGCFSALWLTAAITFRWWLTQPAAWLARDNGDFGSITLWSAAHDAAFLLPWLLVLAGTKSIAYFLTMTTNHSIYYSGAQFVSGAMVTLKPAAVTSKPPDGGTLIRRHQSDVCQTQKNLNLGDLFHARSVVGSRWRHLYGLRGGQHV